MLWLTPSASVVYADEGRSHFSITPNPTDRCLLAPGWLQVIVCCKHSTKLQDCALSPIPLELAVSLSFHAAKLTVPLSER